MTQQKLYFRFIQFSLLLSLLSLFPGVPSAYISKFNVKDYGAIGDGTTEDSHAIRLAFSAARKAGGGIVLFPKPGKYLTAPFNMTSNTDLVIESGSSILGIQDQSKYPVIAPLPSYGKSRDVGHDRYQPLIFGVNLTNIRIYGGGTIDGQGSYWWDKHSKKTLEHGRPRLVEFLWSNKIEIFNLLMKDSGFWTLHPVYCKDVHVHHVNITAPHDSPNSDGIDPDSTQNMLIEHCDVSVGDDVIAIKSGMDDPGLTYNWPTRNLTIRHCRFGLGHGIALGSEMSGGIFDIYIHDCVVYDTKNPIRVALRIKTERGRGNVIENVKFQRIVIENSEDAVISLNMLYQHKEPTHNKTTTPTIRNISYIDIKGKSKGKHGEFICLEESPCHGIYVDNVTTTATKDWVCDQAHGTQIKCSPKTCLIPEY